MMSLKHRHLKKKNKVWSNNNYKMMMHNDLIRKVRTKATIRDLPEEVLTEVLLRLCVKDIVHCVCVQKSWRFLIKTRMFINLYSNYRQKRISSSNANDNKQYLLFWSLYTDGYEIRVDDIQCEAAYPTLAFPPDLSNCSFNCRLVSNGLLCLVDFTATIYLWNPVIRKYKTLPESPHPPYSFEWSRWQAIAFGFLPEVNDYLVVYIVKYGLSDKPHSHYIVACVYSLNTNSWKKMAFNDIPIIDIPPGGGIFVDGVAYWVGYKPRWRTHVMCFDTKTEMLRSILMPHWVDKDLHPFSCLHAFDQSSVCLVEVDNKDSKLAMWVLKGNPMKIYSWENKMIVELRENVKLSLMGLRNNGEPILRKENKLISYNLYSHKSYTFVRSWDRWTPSSFPIIELPYIIKPFTESLDLLDIY